MPKPPPHRSRRALFEHRALQKYSFPRQASRNDLGGTISTLGKIGATDHLSFIRVGLPGFQAVQDYNGYDVRTHHTNMDT